MDPDLRNTGCMDEVPGSVELDTLEGAGGGDSGGPRPVQHQRNLPEVVAGSQGSHLENGQISIIL